MAFSDLPTVSLKKPLERALRLGHPWVYREALDPTSRLASGTLVSVVRSGEALAWGYWDAASPIAVRVLGLGAAPARTSAGARAAAEALVRARLTDALCRRLERLDRSHTNAFRWVHGEADGLPGIHVDIYDVAATVRHDGEGPQAFFEGTLGLQSLLRETGAAVGLTHTLVRRARGAAGEGDCPVRTVRENGLSFAVDLQSGQKGGLFLDQRENRARLAPLAHGKRVLNLFGYTGAFSVYAAAAGALHTDTVDIAPGAIAAAKDNFALNALPRDRAGFYAEDAFAFLEAAVARGQTWDIVITDPPSFAPSENALPAALGAYERLHRRAAQVVAPGGLLAAASCSSHVPRKAFMQTVHEGVEKGTGKRFLLEAYAGAGFDHPVRAAFPEGDYLKFALGRLSPRS